MSLDEQQILPGFPAPEVAPLPPGATVKIALSLIVRDPALQCRSALDEPTVLRYVDVVDELPPVRVIRVGDVDYLVDGWHRFEAHVRAKRTVIAAVVDTGDRRDAILAAVKANSSHGLPRSHEDTRRAVKVLLMDETWCKLSDRKLAELADVSHTHVANQRKTYGVKAGVVLGEEDANRLEGKLPPRWEALSKDLRDYDKKSWDQVRAAKTPRELAKVDMPSWNGPISAAGKLRAEELLVKDTWPFPEDETIASRIERVETVDDEKDICVMLTSKHLPTCDAATLYQLLRDLHTLGKRNVDTYQIKSWITAWAKRPALVTWAEERLAARLEEQASAPQPAYKQAENIIKETNLLKQAALVESCDIEVFRNLRGPDLLPVVRENSFRARAERGGDWSAPVPTQKAAACPVPGCDGWVYPAKDTWSQTCTTCKVNAKCWNDDTRSALARVAVLLKHPGYGFQVGSVIIDSRTIAAIEEIRVNGSATVSMKGGLGKPCRALVSQPIPEIMFVDNKPPPAASEEEAEEDIDEDCDAYQEGMQAYDDEIDEQAEVLTYATAREQLNFLEGYKRAKDEDEGVIDE